MTALGASYSLSLLRPPAPPHGDPLYDAFREPAMNPGHLFAGGGTAGAWMPPKLSASWM